MTTLTPGTDGSSWFPESSSPTTEKSGILSTPNEEISLLSEVTSVSAVCRMTLTRIHRIGAGTARTIGCSPPKRRKNWSLYPDQSMVSRQQLFFGPKSARKRKKKSWLLTQTVAVWCWGWDGAGDLDGPDVDPIWEHMQPRSYSEEAIQIKHYRNMPGW